MLQRITNAAATGRSLATRLGNVLSTSPSAYSRLFASITSPLSYHHRLVTCRSSVLRRKSSFPTTLLQRRAFSANFTPTKTKTKPTANSPTNNYEQEFKQSIENPEAFWEEQAKAVEWFSTDGPILRHNSKDPWDYRWFPERKLNIAYNSLDVHVAQGRGEQVALIWDSPMTSTIQHFTYSQLLEESSRLAGAFKNIGVQKGDVVLLYMPMIPQSILTMLACARIGAVYSVVFGGFAAGELSKRIRDLKPKVIVSASCGLEPARIVPYKPILDEAIRASEHTPSHCIIFQRPQLQADLVPKRDIEWNEFVRAYGESISCVPVKANDPFFVLHTSGTTGTPKGVIRDTGGYAVAVKYCIQRVFGLKPGERYFVSSDIGWVVGNTMFWGPIMSGVTTVLFEGKPVGTPDAGVYWRMITQHKINMAFAAPTAIRAIRREDPEGKMMEKYNLKDSSLKAFWLAGERADPDTVKWAEKYIHVPCIDNYWQTETGWPAITNSIGIHSYPIKPGSACKPIAGYNFQLLNDDGKQMHEPNVSGNIVFKLPMPPGFMVGIWNNPERFVKSYFTKYPSYYDTSDSGFLDEDGYVYVMSRTDDILNVAGHRLSSGQIEEVLTSHPAVAESAVVGIHDELKGQIPIGIVVLKKISDGEVVDEKILEKEIIEMVRKHVGPVAALKHIVVVGRLPKTRSGKIIRLVIRALIDNEPFKVPATIEDESVIEQLRQTFIAKKVFHSDTK